MSLFRCPICAAPLERTERTYCCPAGHSFDIAKEGYVHLLPPNQKHSAAPGDDKAMAAARRDFLSKEYYSAFEYSSLSDFVPFRRIPEDFGCRLRRGLLHRRHL